MNVSDTMTMQETQYTVLSNNSCHEMSLHTSSGTYQLLSNKALEEPAQMRRLTWDSAKHIHNERNVDEDKDQTLKILPQSLLNMSAKAFIGGFCAIGIGTQISCAGPNITWKPTCSGGSREVQGFARHPLPAPVFEYHMKMK